MTCRGKRRAAVGGVLPLLIMWCLKMIAPNSTAFTLKRTALSKSRIVETRLWLQRSAPFHCGDAATTRTLSTLQRKHAWQHNQAYGCFRSLMFPARGSVRLYSELSSGATSKHFDAGQANELEKTSSRDDDVDDDVREEIESSSGEQPTTAFTPGVPKGFFIVDHMATPSGGFHVDLLRERLGDGEIDRLKLTSDNVTLPVALMMLDPETYPSFSRARKACRKGYVLIHRGPLSLNNLTGEEDMFDPEKCLRGRVGDRVYAGDVIAKQVRMGNGWYNAQYHEKPPFDLPVIYEDDHFAIVNKPAGVVTYAHRSAGHGRMSVKAALPFVVKAPKAGTYSVISRPIACHRLDKPTSGLLVVAKTKPAMVHLTKQFAERKVKKTYTAIVNGIPDESLKTSITSKAAHGLGLDVDPDDDSPWQVIDSALDGKHAFTVWRPLRYEKSLKARDGILTLVELKPMTGRFHQLRRHMAWVSDCPLVGDKAYDGGRDAAAFRERGLFLCSNRVTLEHPYYNAEVGRKEWESLDHGAKYAGGMLSLSEDGIVRVAASIDLPAKFESFLEHEAARSSKFEVEESTVQ